MLAVVGTLLAAAGTLLGGIVPAAAGTATCPSNTNKCYLASVAPTTVYAGTPSQKFTVTLTNETSGSQQQQIGSANVTVPFANIGNVSVTAPGPGATAAVSGSVVQLRNLAIPPMGGTATLTLTAAVPNQTNTTYQWSVAVKQANDFNGSGNDFVQDPNSSLTTTTAAVPCSMTGNVSCGAGYIDYSQPSTVTTGSSTTAVNWLVGTAAFPATGATGTQIYSMSAPATPDTICPFNNTLIQCTFEMVMDPIPAPYDSTHAVQLTLLCDGTRCPQGTVSAMSVTVQGDNGNLKQVYQCGLPISGTLCYDAARVNPVASNGSQTLKIVVHGLVAGDPRIAGACLPPTSTC